MRKWRTWLVVFMLVLVAAPIFMAPQTSEAQWRYRYYRYGYPYYGWDYPYSYPYYPYYDPPVVVVPQPQPQPYMQQQPQQQPQQAQQQFWYFCRQPEGFHPYIRECPGGFLKVVPTEPPSSAPSAPAQR